MSLDEALKQRFYVTHPERANVTLEGYDAVVAFMASHGYEVKDWGVSPYLRTRFYGGFYVVPESTVRYYERKHFEP